jgi:hypothetical protein
MTLDELPITFGVTGAHGGHGGLILLAGPDHFDIVHLTARQQQRRIVTRQYFGFSYFPGDGGCRPAARRAVRMLSI